MKRIGRILFFSALVFILLFAIGAFTSSAHAATTTEQQITTFYQGSPWWTSQEAMEDWRQMSAEPYVDEDGNYFVPLSVLHDAFGMYAKETANNTVTIGSRDHTIYQGIDNACVYIDNTPYNDLAPFRNESGIVMVPVERYLSALGYKVERQVTETYPNGFLVITRMNQTVYPSRLEVNKYMQMVTVYGKDYGGKEIPCRYMICSTGASGHETPVGSFRIHALRYFGRSSDPWYYFASSSCWVQYCTQVTGNVCFHSVPYGRYAYSSLSQSGYNNLGRKASHGCIRLMPEDARFVWENCNGLTVSISYGGYSEVLQQKKNEFLASKLPYSTYVQNLIAYGVQ